MDPLTILAALGLAAPSSVEPVKGGVDAAIWRVEHGGKRYALRVLGSDQADQAQREIAAMTAAEAGGIPVPRVVATTTWNDRPTLLLTWSPGRPLLEVLLDDPANHTRVRALGEEFGRVQAAIHAIPLPSQLRDSSARWKMWAGPEPDLASHLAQVSPGPSALLHLDYHPLNVLVEGERVTAVLDWANARAGDPRADVARTLSILRLGPLSDGPTATAARVMRRVFEAGWRKGYEQAAGPLTDLAPFCWWAGAVMERDLAPRLGRPDIPRLTPGYLAWVRRWTANWKFRSGRER
jgi:aminoglycoside phosphotransferase (APT) family kinase protein